MATPYNKKYNDGKYTNPSDNISPKVKQGQDKATEREQKDWFLKKAEFIYSAYLRGDAYIPESTVLDYRINRLYAQGLQPNTKYQEALTVLDKNTGKRKGWMNISWDILPVLPKFRSLVIGKFEDIDYNIIIRAIDDESSSVREDAKMAVMVESKYGQQLKKFRLAIGLPEEMTQEEGNMPYVPRNVEEFEMMASIGAFKLQWEIAMDKLLGDTAVKNNWAQLKRKLIEDAIDLGIIAVKDYQDPHTKKPMCRYVDPENLIIRLIKRNDYDDISEVGEITWHTIEQLRSFGLNDDELQKAATAYNSMWGNGVIYPGQTWDWNKYAGHRIAVLDCEFKSWDMYFYESRFINGKEVVFDLPFGTTKTKGKDRKLMKEQKDRYYRCKWVIGTDVVFDYGLQYDVPYDQYSRPKCSYSVQKIGDRSMINQCISTADDIQLGVLKFRNAMASSRPPGIQVEWGSLSQIAKGGDKMNPFDILKIYNDTGNLIFKYATNPGNGMPLQGGIPPVTELRGGIGSYLQEIIAVLDWNINMIREITGLNSIVDASAPAPNALVGTAKIAEAGTNHVLRPILTNYKSVKQKVFGNLCNRWQMFAIFNESNVSVGGTNVAFETIKVNKDLYKPVFDVYCDALISDEDKARLEQALMQSLQAAKTGSIGITTMDYFYIREIMATGNLRWAWVYLSYRESKMETDRQQAALAQQEASSQAAQQLEQMKMQNDIQRIQIEEEEKRKTLMLEYRLKTQSGIAIAQAKPAQQSQQVSKQTA